jgi:hypothetical protein
MKYSHTREDVIAFVQQKHDEALKSGKGEFAKTLLEVLNMLHEGTDSARSDHFFKEAV